MAFADCIVSARNQGAISREEAEDLIGRYERFRRARGGDPAAAQSALAEDIAAQAERKVRLAQLQEETTDRLRENLATFRTPDGKADVLAAAVATLANENLRLAGFPSVNGRANALIGYAHARLETLLHDQQRTWLTGRRPNKARLDAMVDAAFGGTDDVAARTFWSAYRKVNEEMVGLFNAAGGAIPESGNYLPQRHDPAKMSRAGEAKWIEFTLPRLDREKMIDPFTDAPFTDGRLREALGIAYRRLMTDGWSDRDPSMQAHGRGALANQRGEQRFLIFKDAASWREYQGSFGTKDTFAALMDHLTLLARDVATLDILGPNPGATLEWMKQVVRSEAAKKAAGQESLFNAASPLRDLWNRKDVEAGRVRYAEGIQERGTSILDDLWQEINGGPKPENVFVANFFAGVRNFLTGVQLGATFHTAFVTDPAVAARARQFAGLPIGRTLGSYVAQMREANAREVMRAGILVEDALHHLRLDARQSGMLDGPAWTRILPDRILSWTLLTPHTNMQKRGLAFDFMAMGADAIEKGLDKVDPNFKRYLEGFGVGAREWDLIRSAKAHEPAPGSAGLLRPVDIADTVRSPDAMDLALRFSEAMHALMEEGVPQGSVTTRAAMRGGTRAGTFKGELQRSMAMYLSFSHSFIATTLRGAAHELADGGVASAARYAGGTLITLTVGGMLALQLAQLRAGKDWAPVNDWNTWVAALLRGGGLGVYGDYLLADVSKFGQTPMEKMAGPVVGLGYDLLKVAAPGVAILDREKSYNRADNAVKLLERYMPFANTWYTQLAWKRLVTDQLHYMTNPNAHRLFRDRQRRLGKETGQGYWWAPGEDLPGRAPDAGTAWREGR